MEVEEEFGDQVRFVGVPGLAGESDIREFIESTETGGLDHVLDLDGDIWDRFGITQQRTYVFINDDGSWEIGGYGSLKLDVEDLLAR